MTPHDTDPINPASSPQPQPQSPPLIPRVTEPVPQLPARLDLRAIFEGLLRHPAELIGRMEIGSGGIAVRCGLLATGAMLTFGLVLGCFAKGSQWINAPVKVVAGLAIASLICFPSLVIFSMLSGSRIRTVHLAAVMTGGMALAGLLLLGFAPAVWIFAESTDAFGFIGALGILAWLIAATFSLRFIAGAIRSCGGSQSTPILVWCGIFLLVSLQMTTSLRPILGRSDAFLPNEKRFFVDHWAAMLSRTLVDDETSANAGFPGTSDSSSQ